MRNIGRHHNGLPGLEDERLPADEHFGLPLQDVHKSIVGRSVLAQRLANVEGEEVTLPASALVI